MPVPTQMPKALLRLAGGAQPGLAVGAQVAVVADGHGHVEAAFQVRADRHAGEAHVGRDDDMARLRLDDARHGDADGREVRRFQLGLGEHFLDHRFDHRQDLFRSAGPRRRLPLLAQDGARFADQRGLNLRAADINAQVKPFANRFRLHHELLLLVRVIEAASTTENCTASEQGAGSGEQG